VLGLFGGIDWMLLLPVASTALLLSSFQGVIVLFVHGLQIVWALLV